MSDTPASGADSREPSREEILSALFAQLVLQQSNLAMMLLGKTPHPHSGETTKDIEAARMFIDQLEMIEAKTRGNLTAEEESLLKHSLMSLRLAFVEAVQTPAPPTPPARPAAPPAAVGAEDKASPAPGAAESDARKKFSKRY